jgi:hypothetical protein
VLFSKPGFLKAMILNRQQSDHGLGSSQTGRHS